MVRGACRSSGEDPDLWYPAGFNTADDKQQADDARAICLACPVRVACLESTLAEEEGKSHLYRWGVRGGLFPRERAREAKRREAADGALAA